jgi:hypothetical protein
MSEMMKFIEDDLGIHLNPWQRFYGEQILRRLRVIGSRTARPTFTQVLGNRGQGKTYLAAALAVGLSRRGYKVAVYCADAHRVQRVGELLYDLGCFVRTALGGLRTDGLHSGYVWVSTPPDREHERRRSDDLVLVDDCDLWQHVRRTYPDLTVGGGDVVLLETDESAPLYNAGKGGESHGMWNEEGPEIRKANEDGTQAPKKGQEG